MYQLARFVEKANTTNSVARLLAASVTEPVRRAPAFESTTSASEKVSSVKPKSNSSFLQISPKRAPGSKPTMVAARRETGSGPFVGHEALLRLAKSQQALLEAGGNLARVHGSLLDVQREMGVGEECPPDEPTGVLDDRRAG